MRGSLARGCASGASVMRTGPCAAVVEDQNGDTSIRREVTMSALVFHMIGGAPDPVAPFSHAVEADGWIFLTGQMPFTGTSSSSAYPDTIEAQTHQVMKNLQTVLRGCGVGFEHVAAVR